MSYAGGSGGGGSYAGSKRGRSPDRHDAYDYHGSSAAADWYGGSDAYAYGDYGGGAPSSAGAAAPPPPPQQGGGGGGWGGGADPYYGSSWDRRGYEGGGGGGAGGGYYDRRAEWEAYYREREWEEYERSRRDPYYRGEARGPGPAPAAGGYPAAAPVPPSEHASGSSSDWDLRSRIDGMGPGSSSYSASSHAAGPGGANGHHHPQGGANGINGAAPAFDPLQADFVMPFRQYSDYHKAMGKASEPAGDLGKDYQAYREAATKRALRSFFDKHKNDIWFKERYHPGADFAEKRKLRRRLGRKGLKAAWLGQLKEGKLDKVNFDIRSKPADALGKEEGSSSKTAAESSTEDKEKSTAVDGEGDDAAKDSRREDSTAGESERRPDEDHEANGGEGDGGEGEEETAAAGAEGEGASSSKERANGDGRPSHHNRRDFHPRRGTDRKDLLLTLRDGTEQETGLIKLLTPKPGQLLIPSIPAEASLAELEELFRKHAGDNFLYLAMGDPRENKRWSRTGHVQLAEGTDFEKLKADMADVKVSVDP